MRRTAVASLALSLLLAVPAHHAAAQPQFGGLAAWGFTGPLALSRSYAGCWQFGCSVALIQIGWRDDDEYAGGVDPFMSIEYVDHLHNVDGEAAEPVQYAVPGDMQYGDDWDDARIFPNAFNCLGFQAGPTTCGGSFLGRVTRGFDPGFGLGMLAIIGAVGTDPLPGLDGIDPPGPGQRYDGVVLNAVPEPTALLLVGTGLAGLLGVWRRRRA